MPRHASLATSPDGALEGARLLHESHAYGARTTTAARAKHHGNKRQTVAQVTTALTATVAAGFATVVSGDYKLTNLGLARARSRPQSRYIIDGT